MSHTTDGVTDEPRQLTPSATIKTNMHPDLSHPQIVFTSGKNEYHLVEVDKDGKEVVGSDFSVSETTYQTSFVNNPSFRLKKNIK